jgi:FtsH-binding integral membrane protein
MYTPESVILALCLFTVSTLTLWCASLCLSDISNYAPVMFCSIITGLVLQLLALPVALVTASYDQYLVMEGIGASLIFSIYVVIDLKMIQEHMDVDDYILGAITLYIDLITLFVKILQVVGKRR